MPDINAETARESYTIAGETFSIYQPYAEGHTLTAGEASQLNQVFAENVRNNTAARVKALKESGAFDADAFQVELDQLMADYEMGVRRGGGGRSANPVQAEAMNIARDLVRKSLTKKGYKLSDVGAAEVSRLAKEALDRGDAKAQAIVAQAQARVDAAGDLDLDVEAGTPEATSGKGKKAKAEAPAEGE